MQSKEASQEHYNLKSWLMPWVVCFAATLFFFYEFIQGNMFASIAANIMQDFQIEADKMAYMSSIYYLANVLFLFVAGFVLDRFSIKKTIVVAMFFCVLSTFILAYSESFYVALFCRFVTGIGSAFCFLGPVRLASHWFPPKRMALVTGAIVTMAMTGGLIAQFPLTLLVTAVGWRHAVQDVGMLGVGMLVLMVLLIEERPTAALKKPRSPITVLSAAKMAYLNPQYIRAAMYTSLMNIAIAVFGAMMGTLYLEQRLNIVAEQAAMVNGMLFLGSIIGSPLIGWISDWMGLRILPMKICVLVSIGILLLILYAPVSWSLMALLFFLLGLFTSAQVISYALVAESSPPMIIATAISVVSIITQGGYMIYQNLFSNLLTRFGDMRVVSGVPVYSVDAYQYAASILPIGLLIAFLLLFRLRETHCQHVEF